MRGGSKLLVVSCAVGLRFWPMLVTQLLRWILNELRLQLVAAPEAGGCKDAHAEPEHHTVHNRNAPTDTVTIQLGKALSERQNGQKCSCSHLPLVRRDLETIDEVQRQSVRSFQNEPKP